MSRRANPTAIGLFLIGAAVLMVLGVAVLASTGWFTERTTFISYFGESVNGLEVGAPVKFQGVPVGNVTDLLIRIDQSDKTFEVPVQYEVNLGRLTSQSGGFVDLANPNVLRQQIADGLRAQLQMESIVTGQLYIELSYRTDPDPPDLAEGRTEFPEIPTTPSLLATFGTQAGSLVGEVFDILVQVNEKLTELDLQQLSTSVSASARSIQDLAESPEIRAAFREVPPMSEQFNRTMAEMQLLAEELGASIEPLQGSLDTTNAEVVLTLQSMRRAVEETRGILSTDSGVGYQLEEALSSMKEAADALRRLTISLERNPDMLLRGKQPPEE